MGAATVTKQDIRVILNALGTVTSLNTVTVKTQIAGKITDIAFTEGQVVQKGDFLVQIDPRPYQVALANAQGALARDQAQLKNAQLDLVALPDPAQAGQHLAPAIGHAGGAGPAR